MRKPAVDVIVPCYNYGKYLNECVFSIVNQADVDVRVLVIDDASSDESPEIAARLSAADARVHSRCHATNAGHISTYNEGFAWAEAPYVLLISADDLLIPGALARAAVALDTHPRAVFAYGRQVLFDIEPIAPRDEPWDHKRCAVQPGPDFIAELCRLGHNPVATPTVVVRTAAQHRVGGYDPALPHTADLLNWLKLAAYGDAIFLDVHQAFKRRHTRNMQIQYVVAPEGDVPQRVQAFEHFWRDCTHLLSDTCQLQANASGALARDVLGRAADAFDSADEVTCEELLKLCRSLSPEIAKTRGWRRLSLKRRLGPKLSARLAGVAHAMRLSV
jgi:glycosyltransferase involved in cell wall biosynthesis